MRLQWTQWWQTAGNTIPIKLSFWGADGLQHFPPNVCPFCLTEPKHTGLTEVRRLRSCSPAVGVVAQTGSGVCSGCSRGCRWGCLIQTPFEPEARVRCDAGGAPPTCTQRFRHRPAGGYGGVSLLSEFLLLFSAVIFHLLKNMILSVLGSKGTLSSLLDICLCLLFWLPGGSTKCLSLGVPSPQLPEAPSISTFMALAELESVQLQEGENHRYANCYFATSPRKRKNRPSVEFPEKNRDVPMSYPSEKSGALAGRSQCYLRGARRVPPNASSST